MEFNPPALKMGRVLVGSDGVEATVVVKNPCTFPIEFHSLDFDEQYPEEEEVRRQVPDDVPQGLCIICEDGEVTTLPQMGRKWECSVYKPVQSFPAWKSL